MRKLLRAGLLLLSGTAVMFVFLWMLLLSSSSVTRWLIVQIDAQLPSLSIEKIDGLLLGELHLSDIKYQSEQVTVSVESLAYQFRLADLMAGCIGFKSIQASVVDVLLPLKILETEPWRSEDF